MKITEKGFKWMFYVYIFLFIADLASTLANYKVIKFLEANPLYKYTGLAGLVVFNILVMWILYVLYTRNKSTPTVRFFVINMMVIVLCGRIFALYNNIGFLLNPVTVEVAKQIGTDAAKEATIKAIALIQYPPLFVSIITYLIWRIDHKCLKKEKK